jgi:hypothetical protein
VLLPATHAAAVAEVLLVWNGDDPPATSLFDSRAPLRIRTESQVGAWWAGPSTYHIRFKFLHHCLGSTLPGLLPLRCTRHRPAPPLTLCPSPLHPSRRTT